MNRSEQLPRARDLAKPMLLFLAAFSVTELLLYESPRLPVTDDVLATLLLPVGYFGLFLLWTAWDRRTVASYGFSLPRPLVPALGLAALLVVVYAVVELEPGFGFGFGRTPRLGPLLVVYELAFAAATALGQETVFRGYILGRLLAPRRLAASIGISSVTFALVQMNFPILHSLGPVALGTYLLTTPGLALSLGLVLGFYYYKSSRNLLGPIVLRTGALAFTALTPVVALSIGWISVFLIALLADAVLLLLILAVLREPRAVAHRYLGAEVGGRRNRFVGQLRRSRRLRESIVVGAVAVALVVGIVVGVPDALGTPHPFLAIATGSMVPTFHRGTLVVIQHVPAAEITVGTIVAYRSTCLPSPVVHRVIAITQGPNGPVYTTKGDANPAADPCPVPYSAVLGRVALIVPYLGFFILSPVLTAATAGVAVLLGMLFWPTGTGRFPRRRPTG